ncbi:hypothetical protein ABK249_04315 [Neorhizobium sp. Rsf11]|uniref:Uncharacterized protein n=2 Tax=Neorhizobium TaxID=1525371 RepID=A0ABV0LX18_9HYPH|nr:hypothetical protein [Neorhizobium petrolearium]MCC2611175.1 hypothetical protein [Neorhizobium petrolearium]WGI71380.1 hypothetical protein QEO92_15200 [Neorhizobium petrolearium]
MLLKCVVEAFHDVAGNFGVTGHVLTSLRDETVVHPERVVDDEGAAIEQRKTTMLAALACLVVLAAGYSGKGAD